MIRRARNFGPAPSPSGARSTLASSVAQLDESLAALDLQLSAEQRRLLDEAS